MKKILSILLYIFFGLSLILFSVALFIDTLKYVYFFALFTFIIFVILLIILYVCFPNKFYKKAQKCYKENRIQIEKTLKYLMELSQLKITLVIEENDGFYYFKTKNENLQLIYSFSSIESDKDYLYFCFEKVFEKIFFSHSLKSILHYIFSGSLLVRPKYKHIELVDFCINNQKLYCSKYIRKRFGTIELTSNWRLEIKN